LDTVGSGFVSSFSFRHGQRKIARVAQDIIDPFRGPADKALTRWHDATIGDRAPLGN